MANKLIHYNNKQNFESDKDSITDHSLVFIQDSKEIYTHSEIYKGISWSVLSETAELSNGVYAVNANNELIDYNIADSSCIGVALVAGEHKFMIAKAEATDGTNISFYWTNNTSDLSLTNYSNADGTNSYGYLGKELSNDFTTWKAGALSDFNGKTNTAVIAEASSHAKDMCTVLKTFNQTEQTAGRSADWYVPACGQLALMYLNMTEINAALAKIGGTVLAAGYYWSSSEESSGGAWYVAFYGGEVENSNKDRSCRVRFVRDI